MYNPYKPRELPRGSLTVMKGSFIVKYLKLALLGAFIGVALALAPAIIAEERPKDEAIEVTDINLQRFAKAFVRVRDIGSTYYEKIARAQNDGEARMLQREAQQEMKVAVEDSGLSVEQYDYLAKMVSQNPELFARIDDMI